MQDNNTNKNIVNNDFYLVFYNLQTQKKHYNRPQKGLCYMKNKAVKIGIIASIVPHIFCCGMPIALSLIGLIAPESAHFHLIPHWLEPWLFVISGLMLVFSWYLVARDCRCACEHCGGNRSHRPQKIIMTVITVLFIISVLLHLASHHG